MFTAQLVKVQQGCAHQNLIFEQAGDLAGTIDIKMIDRPLRINVVFQQKISGGSRHAAGAFVLQVPGRRCAGADQQSAAIRVHHRIGPPAPRPGSGRHAHLASPEAAALRFEKMSRDVLDERLGLCCVALSSVL